MHFNDCIKHPVAFHDNVCYIFLVPFNTFDISCFCLETWEMGMFGIQDVFEMSNRF